MAWLYLVRHGETFDNAARRVQGWAPGALTPKGFQQVRALAEKLAAKRIDVVYASPLNRTRQTAELVAEKIRKRIVFRGELKEIDVGRLSGLTFEEVEARYGEVINEVFANPEKSFPDGESLARVQARAMPFVKSVFNERSRKSVLIVAHNAVNRVILASLVGLPLSRCRVFKQYNACLNVLSIKPREGLRVHLLNEPAL